VNILVLNSGGSSVKFKVIDMPEERTIISGSAERIGKNDAILKYKKGSDESIKKTIPIKDHEEAIKLILGILTENEQAMAQNIEAVGHRVVHGGDKLTDSTVINENIINIIEYYCDKAPLHNPSNLLGIRCCQALMTDIPQIAVFDNALHKDLPDYAYIYGIPYRYYEKYGIRKYGFHGITFKYMTDEASKLVGRPVDELKIISLMLGSGCTANAMKYGKSIDVSTGFTPHEGLIQSTRAGDIDATAVTYIMNKEGISPKRMEDILNKESGWLGISGISNDMREIEEQLDSNYRAKLAIEAVAYRAKKYVGAYMAVLEGADLLIFSGGAGEKGSILRKKICSGLEFLGIELDNELNDNLKGQGIISKAGSKVKIMVINTDEEIVIARETYKVIMECNK